MNSDRVKIQAHLALLLMSLIYAANYSIAKIPLEEGTGINPAIMVFLRVAVAGIFFWFTHWFFTGSSYFDLFRSSKRKERLALRKKFRDNRVNFLLCGIFLVPISQLFFFEGLKLTSAVNASIMRLGTPIMVLVLALLVGQEKNNNIKTFGLLLALFGAIILTTNGQLSSINSTKSFGDLLIFLSAAGFAAYMIFSKKLMDNGYSAVMVLKWSFTYGMFFFLMLEFIRGFNPSYEFLWQEIQAINWAGLESRIYLSLFFVFFFATFISYILNISALDKVKPSVAGAYNYIQPVFTTIIAMIFFQYHFAIYLLVGFILILAGIYLVNTGSFRLPRIPIETWSWNGFIGLMNRLFSPEKIEDYLQSEEAKRLEAEKELRREKSRKSKRTKKQKPKVVTTESLSK